VGYPSAAIGALLGAAAGVVLGFMAGAWYAEVFMPQAGLESLGPALAGAAFGEVAGAGLGSWTLLSLAGRPRSAFTAGLTALLVPPLLGLLILIGMLGLLESFDAWLWGLGLAMAPVAALLARAMASRGVGERMAEGRLATAGLWVAAAVEIVVLARLAL
jgi:hypothetical protein